MKTVLALSSAADPTGSVRQFDLALPLLREWFDVVRHTPPADVNKLLLTTTPDLIHTLGADAFRAVKNASVGALGRGRRFPKWVAAGAAAVDPTLGLAPGLTATISQSEHERDWAARLTPAPMQFTVPVGVSGLLAPRAESEPARGASRPQTILAAGGFDAVANLKHAVWAFDTFRYAHPTAQLVLLGDGPLRADLQRFARSLSLVDPVVRFVGFQAEVEPYLSAASQVWCTHTRGGTKFLLEAMASGVPVIAYSTPDMERVIGDGANGRLVPVGRPVEVARVAHSLLASPDRARMLVVAGEGVASRYPVADLADALAGVYDTLTSSASPRSE